MNYLEMIFEMDRMALLMGVKIGPRLKVSYLAYKRMEEQLGHKAMYVSVSDPNCIPRHFSCLRIEGVNDVYEVFYESTQRE